MNEEIALKIVEKLPFGLSIIIWEFILPSTKEILMKEKVQKIINKYYSFQFYDMIKQIPNDILIQFSKGNTINKYHKFYTIRRFFDDNYSSLYEYLLIDKKPFCFHPFHDFQKYYDFNSNIYCVKCMIDKIRYEIKETMEYAIYQKNNNAIIEIYNNILYLRDKYSIVEINIFDGYNNIFESYTS